MIIWCLVALLLLTACNAPNRLAPEALYENARRELRRGNFNQAATLADLGLRQGQNSPASRWHWQFRLLQAQILVTQGKAKDALPLLETRLPEGPEFGELLARQRMLQGRAAHLLGEYPKARELLDEAFELTSKIDSPILLAEIELWRGSALVRLGDFAAGDASYQNALETGIRQVDLYLQSAALGNMGFARLNHARYDEAIPLLERALAASEKIGNRDFTVATLGNLGNCYYGLGDLERALKLLSLAESDAGRWNLRGRHIWLGNIGNVYYSQKDFRNAISSYQRALTQARQVGDAFSVAQWLNDLALASIDSGNLTLAETYNREALELGQRMENPNSRMWPLLNAARIAAARKQFEQAERFYSDVIALASGLDHMVALWEAQAGLANLFVASQQWSKADQQFQLAVSTIENTRARLARVEWKFTFLAQLIRFYQDYVDFLMERGQPGRALEVAESARARVLAERLGLKQVSERKASAVQFQQQARALNAVLLSYWLAPRRSFLWVITPQTTAHFVLPSDSEIRGWGEAYRSAVLSMRDPLENSNPAGRWLYDALIAPAARQLHAGARVIVVPDGYLHELNLETLLVPGDRLRYWIEEVTITVAPSLAVLQTARQNAKNGRRLLLLGSPVSPGPEYPPLPASELEVAKIQELFREADRTVVTGPQAHPGAYGGASPGSFALIHFSAHAVANRESPLDSAVILSRKQDAYKLYARDVAALPLRAELVTISACRSAGARTYSGEGLVGFTWAFLQAGARNVIAGLWDVADRSTSELMIQLYAGLADGLGPAEALRSAKLALVRSNSAYRKPYYWAPFQLYTRSTPFTKRLQRSAR